METWEFQKLAGIEADNKWGPVTNAAFLSMFVNTRAPAISEVDMVNAASKLGVPLANLKALSAKESGRSSFDNYGRPVILFEGHWFSRLTGRRYDRTHPSISHRSWTRRFYGRTMSDRYNRLAAAASLNIDAAICSASWGKFQIMGFHWEKLGYKSPFDFAMAMVASETNHLDALVRFVNVNGLSPLLAKCKPNDRESCVDFSRRYNGSGFWRNRYALKLSQLIARYT